MTTNNEYVAATPENESLDWLAFQYVADELDDDDRDAFEERLANDLTAAEAVAAAVEWTVAVMQSSEVELKPRTAEATGQAARFSIAFGSALALLIVAGGVAIWWPAHSLDRVASSPATEPTDNNLSDNLSDEALAAIWAGTREAYDWTQHGEDSYGGTGGELASDLDMAPKDWIVLAISGLTDDMTADDDDDHEDL